MSNLATNVSYVNISRFFREANEIKDEDLQEKTPIVNDVGIVNVMSALKRAADSIKK